MQICLMILHTLSSSQSQLCSKQHTHNPVPGCQIMISAFKQTDEHHPQTRECAGSKFIISLNMLFVLLFRKQSLSLTKKKTRLWCFQLHFSATLHSIGVFKSLTSPFLWLCQHSVTIIARLLILPLLLCSIKFLRITQGCTTAAELRELWNTDVHMNELCYWTGKAVNTVRHDIFRGFLWLVFIISKTKESYL